MRKYCFLFCAIALVCALFTGCGSTPPNPSANHQTPSFADGEDGQKQESSDNTGSAAISGQGDNLPDAYVYTTEDRIIPMSQSATVDGITYQVLDCEVTSEFGSRKLENLNVFEDGSIDDKGNLVKDRRYVFLTIQFTNTTDSEVEILRNEKGIFFLDEHLIIDDYTIDAVYIDEYWLGGTAGEIYHYKLAPGESITSEVGWIVSEDAVNDHDSIYYSMRLADSMTDFGGSTDPDAIFIDLEY